MRKNSVVPVNGQQTEWGFHGISAGVPVLGAVTPSIHEELAKECYRNRLSGERSKELTYLSPTVSGVSDRLGNLLRRSSLIAHAKPVDRCPYRPLVHPHRLRPSGVDPWPSPPTTAPGVGTEQVPFRRPVLLLQLLSTVSAGPVPNAGQSPCSGVCEGWFLAEPFLGGRDIQGEDPAALFQRPRPVPLLASCCEPPKERERNRLRPGLQP